MSFTVTIPTWLPVVWLIMGVLVYGYGWYRYWRTDARPETVVLRAKRRWRTKPWEMVLAFFVTVLLWPWALWENR